MLLLNTRSRPTWLSLTLDRRRPEEPGRRMVAGHDQVASDRVRLLAVRQAAAADPDSEVDRPVRDPQVAPDAQVAEAVEHEREVGRAVDHEVVPDLHRAAGRVRRVVPGLHRLRLRGEEVVPDGHALEVRPAAQTEQLHVVPDRRPQDVGPRLLSPSDEIVPDRRIRDVGAGIGSSGDDVVPDGRLRDVCSGEVAGRPRRWPMLVPEISAPALSRRIRSCVIVAPVTRQKPPSGTIRS